MSSPGVRYCGVRDGSPLFFALSSCCCKQHIVTLHDIDHFFSGMHCNICNTRNAECDRRQYGMIQTIQPGNACCPHRSEHSVRSEIFLTKRKRPAKKSNASQNTGVLAINNEYPLISLSIQLPLNTPASIPSKNPSSPEISHAVTNNSKEFPSLTFDDFRHRLAIQE